MKKSNRMLRCLVCLMFPSSRVCAKNYSIYLGMRPKGVWKIKKITINIFSSILYKCFYSRISFRSFNWESCSHLAFQQQRQGWYSTCFPLYQVSCVLNEFHQHSRILHLANIVRFPNSLRNHGNLASHERRFPLRTPSCFFREVRWTRACLCWNHKM